ncbi:OmpP1/FadL family transporter [Burkholderia pseudomultivorans]|uniref:Uncharacterized protein n=1 Tax=Burkholderia pseudomultivorans TaxID=1207504 RepID=A0A132EAX5_9BURK|nr:outer membrane protein transport protein [Burkholderia pseudomultivorans]KWF21955.1 hypothetical protein WT56_27430 [Burkholderia pseudomultivorans]
MRLTAALLTTAVFFVILTHRADAATGMFLQGYGIQEQGMGGASIAAPQTAEAAATNPAGMGVVGDRVDGALGILYTRTGAELNGVDYRARAGLNPFPEFGYSHRIRDDLAIGVSVWAAGAGVNYSGAFGKNLFPASSKTSDQLVYVNVAPTVAYRIAPGQWIGLSVVTGIGTAYLDGIEGQTGQSNQGRDWAVGAGVRIGWLGELAPGLTGGAFYATKVYFTPFSKYASILADGGRVDEPGSFGAGIAYRPNPATLLAFDYVRYLYADVPALGNGFPGNGVLGSSGGPGFGWRNQNVFRFGVSYGLTSRITVRAGFAEASSQISSNNTAFSFAAPLTTRHNLTFGATYRLSSRSDLSFAYGYGFHSAVTGTGTSLNALTSPYSTVSFFAIGYSRKF